MGNTSAKIHTHITSPVFRAHQIKCKTLLTMVLDAAKQADIRLFAVRELALAAALNQEMLPWSDELALGILDKDVAAFEDLIKTQGWVSSRHFWGIRIRMFGDCLLDVYVYKIDHDIRFQSLIAQFVWPEQRFDSLSEVLPIQYKRNIPVPNDLEAYVSRVYGTRYRTECTWHAPQHQNMGLLERMMHARSSNVNVDCDAYRR